MQSLLHHTPFFFSPDAGAGIMPDDYLKQIDGFVTGKDSLGRGLADLSFDIDDLKKAQEALQKSADAQNHTVRSLEAAEEKRKAREREINDLCRRLGEPARYPNL